MPLLFSNRSLSPILLWWRLEGSGVLSLCFCCCQGVCTQQAACHTGHKLPEMPPCFFFASCPPQSQLPLSECYLSHDYTWDHLASVPFLSLDQLQTLAPYPPCLLFSAHILTLNCLENRKRVEAASKKRKRIKVPESCKKKEKEKRCL